MKRRLGWKKFSLLTEMSIVGLWASMVLIVYNTLHEQLPACSIPSRTSGGIEIDCGRVLSSPYSNIFGVPLEVFAVGYFIANLLLIYLVGFGTESIYKAAFKTLFAWRFIGLTIVPYLVIVEVFVVRAICLYCTVMHVSIVVDFVIISYLLFYRKEIGLASVSKQLRSVGDRTTENRS